MAVGTSASVILEEGTRKKVEPITIRGRIASIERGKFELILEDGSKADLYLSGTGWMNLPKEKYATGDTIEILSDDEIMGKRSITKILSINGKKLGDDGHFVNEEPEGQSQPESAEPEIEPEQEPAGGKGENKNETPPQEAINFYKKLAIISRNEEDPAHLSFLFHDYKNQKAMFMRLDRDENTEEFVPGRIIHGLMIKEHRVHSYRQGDDDEMLQPVDAVPFSIFLDVESDGHSHRIQLFRPGSPPGEQPITLPSNMFRPDYNGKRRVRLRVHIRDEDGNIVKTTEIRETLTQLEMRQLRANMSQHGFLVFFAGERPIGSVDLNGFIHDALRKQRETGKEKAVPTPENPKATEAAEDSLPVSPGKEKAQQPFAPVEERPENPPPAQETPLDGEEPHSFSEPESRKGIEPRLEEGGLPEVETLVGIEKKRDPMAQAFNATPVPTTGKPAGEIRREQETTLEFQELQKELHRIRKELQKMNELTRANTRMRALDVISRNSTQIAAEFIRVARMAGQDVSTLRYSELLKDAMNTMMKLSYNALSPQAEPLKPERVEKVVEGLYKKLEAAEEKIRAKKRAQEQRPG
jgi:hypothetical protein